MKKTLDNIKALIEKIKADCEDLKNKGELSERGKGQLDIARLIEEKLEK